MIAKSEIEENSTNQPVDEDTRNESTLCDLFVYKHHLKLIKRDSFEEGEPLANVKNGKKTIR